MIKPMPTSLLVLIACFLSALLVFLLPSTAMVGQHPWQLFHIVSATIAFSVLCMGGVQAITLAIQERALHRKQWEGWGRLLPSLEMQEVLLFRWIGLGFLLLTAVLITSLWVFKHMLFTELLEKSLFSIVTWGIFALLLYGRYVFGWRGSVAIRLTGGGIFLLALTYFFQRWMA
jgi:ABC-type uncharacterized transport system permease subunit